MNVLSPTSEQLLRTVAAALPGGSVNVFDRAFRYLFVAGDGLDGVDLSPERLVGCTLRDVFGADAELVEPYYARAFAGENVAFDLPVFGRIYTLTAAPFSATIEAIIVLAQDATVTRGERQRHDNAEAALRAVNASCHHLGNQLAELKTTVHGLVDEMRTHADAVRTLADVVQRLTATQHKFPPETPSVS